MIGDSLKRDDLVTISRKEYDSLVNDAKISSQVGSLGHDLSNNSMAIIAFLDLIEMVNDDIPPNMQEYLKRIRISEMKGHMLSRGFMDKIKYGKNHNLQEVCIKDIINAGLSSISIDKRYKNINIDRSGINPDISGVYGIPSDILHVIDNIISNAAESMYGKDTGELRVDAYNENRNVKIKIRDAGCGIKPEDKEKIFESFYTTKNMENSGRQGNGIGLDKVLEIMNELDGKISVDTEEGEYTEFTLTFPSAHIQKKKAENYKTIESAISDREYLPAMADVLHKIITLMQSDSENSSESFADVAERVCDDPAISSRILKVANSAYYGRSGSVDNIKSASVLLGINELKKIAWDFLSYGMFKPSVEEFGMNHYWEQSVMTANIASDLNQKIGDSSENDRFYTAGLMSDIGKLIAAEILTEEYSKALGHYDTDLLDMEQEKDYLGITHDIISAMYLQEHLKINGGMIEAIRAHHEADEKSPLMQKILYISNNLAEKGIDGFDDKDLASAQLDISMEECREIYSTAEQRVQNIKNLL